MRSTVAGLLGACLLLATGACNEEPTLQVPERLIGRWVSENEEYAGRFFEITDSYIAFGMGDGLTQYYMHYRIEEDYQSGAPLYRMEYVRRPGGRPLQFTFYWRSGTIQPLNQPTVRWKKQRS